MKNLHAFSIAAALALTSAAALAQQTAASAAAPAAAASASMDCSKAMKRHQHSADRGAGVSTSKDCPAETSAKKTKKPAHDHAKFHKNQ